MLQMFRSLRREAPGFGLLLSGQFVSLLGDRAASLTLAWVVLSLTNSTLAMGAVSALFTLPFVLLLPFTGWVTDNLPRLRVMAATDLVRALAVGAVALLAWRHHLQFWMLQALVVILGAGSAFFMPPSQAVRAELLTPDVRAAGNSLGSIVQQLPTLLGPLLGAGLLALGGTASAFGLGSASYLISLGSLLLLARVRRWQEAAAAEVAAPADVAAREPFRQQVLGGLRFVLGSPWLAVTIAVFSFINIFLNGVSAVLLPWLIKEHLHLQAGSLALTTTAMGLGAMVGGYALGRLPQLRRRVWWAYGGILLEGLAVTVMPFAPLPMIILLAGCSGIGLAVFGIIWETSLQELVPRELFGRVVSLDLLGSLGLSPVGVLLVGWIAQVAGGVTTFMWLGILTVLFALVALAFPGVRAYD